MNRRDFLKIAGLGGVSLAVPVGELRTCQICRSLFCQHCEIYGYGRNFCGDRCRDMFFFGDGEDSEKDF